MKKTKKQVTLDAAFITARDGVAVFAQGLQHFAKIADASSNDKRAMAMQQHLDNLVWKAIRRDRNLRWASSWHPSSQELGEAQDIMDGK